MPTSVLANVYLGRESAGTERVALPLDDRLANEVRRFPLLCMPNLDRSKLAFVNTLLQKNWFRLIASLIVNSVNTAFYHRKSIEDIEYTRILINKVASSDWPIELKALVIHNLLAFVVAYRSDAFFQHTPKAVFMVPVWQGGSMVLKECCWDRDINLLGGVSARVFVPADGGGSPTYVPHGTYCWNCANGAGVSMLDDFNPLGVGEMIRCSARRRLRKPLEEHRRIYGEPAIWLGHSLGGILAMGFAVDFPDLISRVFAFGPPRPSAALKQQWQRLKSPPLVTTFIGCYGNLPDPVTLMGEAWLGRVFEIRQNPEGDPVRRHIHPVANSLDFEISEVAIEPVAERGAARWMLYRAGSAVIFCFLLPVLAIKRLCLGWNTGGRWKYGLLGLPFRHRKP